MSRDHGGDLDRAVAEYSGRDWIDLSTGINRIAYRVPLIEARLWTDLPRAADLLRLKTAAAALYGLPEARILPVSGAQAAIQLYPRLGPTGRARVLGPTYNEHAGSLAAQGWQVETVTEPAQLAGADLAVVVNPNNPDGRLWARDDLLALAASVGRLIVDESFADPVPMVSVAAQAGQGGMIVLRSFGKFWGLAGLRLGFALGNAGDIARLAALGGPWAVSGPACAIGAAALSDRDWQIRTTARLAAEAARLDEMAAQAGWPLVGGAHLFRTYDTGDAAVAQARLAGAQIWSRIFPYSGRWLRLGLPGAPGEWDRLQAALRA